MALTTRRGNRRRSRWLELVSRWLDGRGCRWDRSWRCGVQDSPCQDGRWEAVSPFLFPPDFLFSLRALVFLMFCERQRWNSERGLMDASPETRRWSRVTAWAWARPWRRL